MYLGVCLEREDAGRVGGGQHHLALVGAVAVRRQAQGPLDFHALQGALSSKLQKDGHGTPRMAMSTLRLSGDNKRGIAIGAR